jgi:surfeit locus 1 family protein
MSIGPLPRAAPGWKLPALLALVGVAVLVGLGVWQIERKAWKEALIATLAERLSQAPGPLPAKAQWDRLAQAQDEFRRVAFEGTFLHDREARVYTAGSAVRPDVSGPGYWVMTPARLADGSLVIVDRGFVPEARGDPATRAQGQVAGPVALTGVLRWPEETGWFMPGPDPARNLWFRLDPAGIAAAKGLGPVAPFYVAQEGPIPPGGLPKPGRLAVNLRNEHLQYALTWFGLAAVLIVVFMSWIVSRRRAA